MAKPPAQEYKYKVTLPDGTTYLTTTLAEARAIEARGNKPRGPVLRRSTSAPGRNPLPNGRGRIKVENPFPTSQRALRRPLEEYNLPRTKWFREIVQNSRDAKAKNLRFDGDADSLTAIDDGKGMDLNILMNKYLVLGQTDKDAGDIGGFGEAKKLILWPWGKWCITTRKAGGDLLTILGVGDDYNLYVNGQGPVKYWYVDGVDQFGRETKVAKVDLARTMEVVEGSMSLHDVPELFAKQGTAIRIWGTKEQVPLEPDARSLLSYCTLPDLHCTFNGNRVVMDYRPPSSGELEKFNLSSWSNGVKATLYIDTESQDFLPGCMLVRAGGLCMWYGDFPKGTLVLEIVGDTKELLNSLRDNWVLQYEYDRWANALRERMAKDIRSAFKKSASFDKDYASQLGSAAASREDAIDDKVWAEVAGVVEAAALEMREVERLQRAEEAARRLLEAQVRALEQKKEQRETRLREQERRGEAPSQPVRKAVQLSEDLSHISKKNAKAILAIKGSTRKKVELITWAPPLRMTNTWRDWRPTPSWLPEGMTIRRKNLLLAWTAIIKRCLGVLGHFDHKFGVGFIWSQKTLARTDCDPPEDSTLERWAYPTFYLLNPFVTKGEMREGELAVARHSELYSGVLKTDPTSDASVELDARNPRHVSIMVARALHELVHGVYGALYHDENFSSIMTSLWAATGDQFKNISNAGLAVVGKSDEDERPGADQAGGRTIERTGVTRKPPTKIAKAEGGRDSRLPPVGTELTKSSKGQYVSVVVGRSDDGKDEFYVRYPHQHRGIYSSLSKAASTISGVAVNGYLFFSLPDTRHQYLALSDEEYTRVRRHVQEAGRRN